MEARITEYGGCFSIELEPKTQEELAMLVRFGLNRTKKIKSAGVFIHQDLTAHGHVVTGKRVNTTAEIEGK